MRIWNRAALTGFVLALSLSNITFADVVFDGFADTSNLQINGVAATASTTDGTVLRVTTTVGNQSGSFFSFDRVSTTEFTSIFSFRISDPGGPVFDFNNEPGADGLVFVVQNVANTVGAGGGGIGYQGIADSVGIEFDTWGNSAHSDPSQSHIGINVGGSVHHNSPGMGPTAIIGNTNVPTTDVPGPELDDGDRWWSWIRYDGTNLDVFLRQSESVTEPSIPSTRLLSFPIDLSTTLGGSDQAFVGFTSGTGADWANHDIVYWRYTEAVVFASADFDQDGDVDGDDFLAWQGGFGTQAGAQKSDGDYDNDGDVDGDDFLGWQAEFGSGGGSASVAVPEPTSMATVLLMAAVAVLSRRGGISQPSR